MSLEFKSYEITPRINGNGEVFARITGKDTSGKDNATEEHRIKCSRFRECKGADYNAGFVRYLCSSDPMQCATANPAISMHPEGPIGHRASKFTPIEESRDYA